MWGTKIKSPADSYGGGAGRRALASSLLALVVFASLSNAPTAQTPPQDGALDPDFGFTRPPGGGVVRGGGKVRGPTTAYGGANAIALQTDGKMIGVTLGDPNDTLRGILLRYNQDGTPDDGSATDSNPADRFGTGAGGSPGTPGAPNRALAIDSNDNIWVAGTLHTSITVLETWDFQIAKYTPNGQPDPDFGTDGAVKIDFGTRNEGSNFAYALALQADGKIVAAGAGGSATRRLNGVDETITRFALARFLPDGRLDPDFDQDGKVLGPVTALGRAHALVIQPGGKIVVAGGSSEDVFHPDHDDFILLRFNPNGSLDDGGPSDSTPGDSFGNQGVVRTSFGASTNEQAYALALQETSLGPRLVAAGCTQESPDQRNDRCNRYGGEIRSRRNNFALARYLMDGGPDPEFGTEGKVIGPPGGAYSLAVQEDGKLVAAGGQGSTADFHPSEFAIVRFAENGVLDASFGTGGIITTDFGEGHPPSPTEEGEREARSVLIQPDDGKIVAAGLSKRTGSTFGDLVMARYLVNFVPKRADLSVAHVDSPDPVNAGSNLRYEVTTRNAGLGPALDATVQIALPQGPPVFAVEDGAGACSQSGDTLTCELGSIPSGGQAEVAVTVTPQAPGDLTSTARVSSVSPDPDSANNTATAATRVVLPDGEWVSTASLQRPLHGHTATQITGPGCGDRCGDVLIAGGSTGSGLTPTAAAELYDPLSGAFAAAPDLTGARLDHTATALGDGKILVAGGRGPSGLIASAELYDPASGQWTPAPPMAAGRSEHTATLLADGRVLVAGGAGATSEIYDPVVGAWRPAGAMAGPSRGHTATLLPSGKVLVVGGFTGDPNRPFSPSQLFDPATGAWSPAAGPAVGRSEHTATLLKDGRVLIAGGNTTSGGAIPTASAEIYDPGATDPETGRPGRWTPAPQMATPRIEPSANLLPDGTVLIAGGLGREPVGPVYKTTELYIPFENRWEGSDLMHYPRYRHTATFISGPPEICGARCGTVLATGGLTERTGPGPSEPVASAEYYIPKLIQPPPVLPPPDGADPQSATSADPPAQPVPPAVNSGGPGTLAKGPPVSITPPTGPANPAVNQVFHPQWLLRPTLTSAQPAPAVESKGPQPQDAPAPVYRMVGARSQMPVSIALAAAGVVMLATVCFALAPRKRAPAIACPGLHR